MSLMHDMYMYMHTQDLRASYVVLQCHKIHQDPITLTALPV